jgi:galactonate dehydratase
MRITGIDFCGVAVTPRTNWCFLLVRTEDGRTGLGECTLANQEALLAAEAARLATRVVGWDAHARNRLARLLPHAQGGLVAQTVLSAFEGALWDLAGQEQGRPIHALLGGALRETVPLYANINRGTNPRTPEGFAAAAGRAQMRQRAAPVSSRAVPRRGPCAVQKEGLGGAHDGEPLRVVVERRRAAARTPAAAAA